MAMERARYKACFELLDKLNNSKNVKENKIITEDVQQYRYATTKLLQCVTKQDKYNKDMLMKNTTYVDCLVSALEVSLTVQDRLVISNTLAVISELIGKSHVSKRVAVFVSHGCTQVVFHIICDEFKESTPCEDIMYNGHAILARLATKDRKFGVKARLSQSLPVTLSMIKSYLASSRMLQPLLHVLKLYSANAVNASYLGKNGAISLLFRILSFCSKKNLTILKFVLDTLGLLLKSKSNSARAVGHGGIPHLISLYYDWHRNDPKNKNIPIRKSILAILKSVTNLKSGRKALADSDGIRVLYNTCMESNDQKEVDGLVMTASLIMRKCFPKNRIPLGRLHSPLAAPVPECDTHLLDISVEVAPPPRINDNKSLGRSGCSTTCSTTAGDDSSLDNDDDISSEEDATGSNKAPSEEEEVLAPNTRSATDLQSSYNEFFQELFDFEEFMTCDDEVDVEDEEDSPSAADSNSTIVIPTALNESELSLPRAVRSQPNFEVSGKACSYRDRVPSLPAILSQSSDNQYDNRPRSAKPFLIGSESIPPQPVSRSATSITPKPRSPFLSGSESIPPQPVSRSATSITPKPRSPFLSGSESIPKTPVSRSATSITPKPKSKTINTRMTKSNINRDIAQEAVDDSDDDWEDPLIENIPDVYPYLAAETNSVGRFSKIAYPDLYGSRPPPYVELHYQKPNGVQRAKVFEDIDRMINPDSVIERVVYDLDDIIAAAGDTYKSSYSNLTNRDEIRIAKGETYCDDCLKFDSQFESGNLRRAIQIRQYEYDLILNPDVNTNHHHQWFYFEVSNMEAGIKYRFNIINCEKPNSQLNFGMQPVMFSVSEALAGKPYWRRIGTNVCYYKNHFLRSSQTTGGVSGKPYYTSTFTIEFPIDDDVCYLAYHYPYTYTTLKAHIHNWENSINKEKIYFRNQTLCNTLGGNDVPLLTITANPTSFNKESIKQLRNRPYIVLTSRVHPGETNASWVMRGTIQYLLSNKTTAQFLRETYIFKIVPVLNPDGVINGNHRCSLTAEDLNRRWAYPCSKLHPSIYHTKGLMQYLQMMNRSPYVYCDYHGHSRKKNVFMYGCSPQQSWLNDDRDNPTLISTRNEDPSYKALPRILHNIGKIFSLANCCNIIEKNKEATARIVVWRQIRVVRSYTMEATYCGCDFGSYRGLQITPRELEEMGRKFCEGLARLKLPACYSGPIVPPSIARALAMAAEEEEEEDEGTLEGAMSREEDRGDELSSTSEEEDEERFEDDDNFTNKSDDEDDVVEETEFGDDDDNS